MVESMKESVEVESCIRRFPWLIKMVKSRLFHEYCDQHTGKMRCYFCCDCMIPPFCCSCFKKDDHKDHLTIQAYRCSNQTGVRKDTITKYMDASGIHAYIINGSPIVFINQRRGSNDNHRSRNNVLNRCKVCEWDLDAAASALFCSVECKFRNALGSQLDEMMEDSSEDVEPVKEKRKHRRKGIPCRSPFF